MASNRHCACSSKLLPILRHTSTVPDLHGDQERHPPVTDSHLPTLRLSVVHLAQSHRQTAQAGPDLVPPLGGKSACLLGSAAWIVGQVGLLVTASLALLGGLAPQEPCAMGCTLKVRSRDPADHQ